MGFEERRDQLIFRQGEALSRERVQSEIRLGTRDRSGRMRKKPRPYRDSAKERQEVQRLSLIQTFQRWVGGR